MGTYRATPFGKKISDLYVDPRSAIIMKTAVERADEDADPILILQAVSATPDMMGMFPKKGDSEILQGLEAQYSDSWLVTAKDECANDISLAEEVHLSNLKVTAILNEWISETSEDRITQLFGIGPGDIRMKVDTANWLLYAMSEIAYLFKPENVRQIRALGTRAKYGIKEELIPLVSLKGVGRSRARTLY